MFLRRLVPVVVALAAAVAVVAVIRRRRLEAATADFEQRHGPA